MNKISKENKTQKKGHKTSLNMNENVEALLAYVLGWLTGIIFLVIEKDSEYVRFHAMQSLVTFLSLTILSWIFGLIPFIGQLINFLIGILGLILWIICMLKAYKHEKFELPFAGKIAKNILK